MVELTPPVCEAQVSPELLALVRGGSWRASATVPEAQADPDPHDAVVPSAALPMPHVAPVPEWPVVSLRRDGTRPLRFPGLMITTQCESLEVWVEGVAVPVARRLSLYLTREGEAVAHVVCLPAEDQPARPVHRAARVESADDLAAVLRAASPDTCFAVSRVAAQWEGQDEDLVGPIHITRSVPLSETTE